MKEMIAEYLRQMSGKYAPKTIRGHRYNLGNFVRYLENGGKQLRPEEISREKIIGYQRYLKKKGRKTVEYGHLQALRDFFHYLKREGRILLDPFSGIEIFSYKKGTARILTEEEVMKLLNTPNVGTDKGIRDRALLELLYSTGIRREEAAKIKIYDLDCQGGYLKVDGNKSKKERVVPVGREALSWINRYLSRVREQYCLEGEELFISLVFGRKLAPESISNHIVHENAVLAGLKNVSSHALRHACASHMLKNGADIRYIKELLGHKHLSTTQVYTHLNLDDLTRVHRLSHPRP